MTSVCFFVQYWRFATLGKSRPCGLLPRAYGTIYAQLSSYYFVPIRFSRQRESTTSNCPFSAFPSLSPTAFITACQSVFLSSDREGFCFSRDRAFKAYFLFFSELQ